MAYLPGGMSSDEDYTDDDELDGFFCSSIPRPVRKPIILEPHEILLKAAQIGDYNEVLSVLDNAQKEGRNYINYVYTSHRNWSLLMFACSGRNLKLITLLLERGANPNHMSSDGYCPILAMATSIESMPDIQSKRTIEGIQLLIKYGANIKASERPGSSPIALAAKNGRTELVKFFIDKGLDINGKDVYQTTALHFAAQFGYKKLTRVLLDNGADVLMLDQEGCTPYTRAVENGHQKLGAILQLVETTEWRPGQDPELRNNPKSVLSLHESNYLTRFTLPEKSQIAMFLTKISLDSLIPLFEAQDINYLTFLRLTDEDLIDTGVQNVSDRQAILETIQSIRTASWNTASNSHFLQGYITAPEVLCLLSDVAIFSKKLAKNAVGLQKAVLQNAKLFLVGKESFTVKELITRVDECKKSTASFRKSVLQLQSVLLEEECPKNEEKQRIKSVPFWSNSKTLIGFTAVIPIVVLGALAIRHFNNLRP